jgi:3-hydroxyacyl-[acyl-carrier-protein] dehydratase
MTVFESQKRAESVKGISLAEDHLHDHFKYYPVMPASLIIEGIAQTAGLLLCEAKGYREKVVLAKIPRFTFHCVEAVPGDVLTYKARLESIRNDGGVAMVEAYNGNVLMADGEMMFAHLSINAALSDQTLFADGDLIEMMRIFRVYEVGIAADGSKLLPPKEVNS